MAQARSQRAATTVCTNPGFVLRYDQIGRISEASMLRLSKKTDYALPTPNRRLPVRLMSLPAIRRVSAF
jgi:hypothetical protein